MLTPFGQQIIKRNSEMMFVRGDGVILVSGNGARSEQGAVNLTQVLSSSSLPGLASLASLIVDLALYYLHFSRQQHATGREERTTQ